MKCVNPTIAIWNSPHTAPICDKGDMIPVIMQQGGKVFGGWYCNEYPLVDAHDAWDGLVDDNGYALMTGFCVKLFHCDFDEYYEFAAIRDLQAWAYMPEPLKVPNW